jgi:ABC-type multidrug transport system fused ATPase/permease subunit
MKRYSKGIFKKLFTYTKGNRIMFFLGVISSIIGGGVNPIVTIFMAKLVLAIFSLSSNNPAIVNESRDDANRNCLIIVLLSIITFFSNLL